MTIRNPYLFLLSAILLPLIIMYFVYFGFTSAYVQNIFSKESFKNQYDQDIYRYRVLSKFLLLELHEVMTSVEQEFSLSDNSQNDEYENYIKTDEKRMVLFLDKKGDVIFYKSLFMLNAIFTVMTTSLAYFLLQDNRFYDLSSPEVASQTVMLAFLIGITQFSVNPYDCSAYFFLIASIYMTLIYINNPLYRHLAWLCIITSLATLNREIAAIGLSFIASLSLIKFGIKQTKTYVSVLLPCGCFLFFYFMLRLVYGFENAIHADQIMYFYNFRLCPRNIAGFAFCLTFIAYFFAIAKGELNKRIMLLFLIFTLPYIIMILYIAYIFETRETLPLVIGCMFSSLLSANFVNRLRQS